MTATVPRPANLLDTFDAVEHVLAPVPNDTTVVFSNGYLAREGVRIRPGAPDFAMIGSMGLALAIGVGISVATPERPVVVVEGDGNLLMGLATMPVAATATAGALLHVVVDNGAYASTGGQATVAAGVDLAALATAAGYRSACTADDPQAIGEAIAARHGVPGAHLVRVRTVDRRGTPSPRVSRTPVEIAAAVRAGRS